MVHSKLSNIIRVNKQIIPFIKSLLIQLQLLCTKTTIASGSVAIETSVHVLEISKKDDTCTSPLLQDGSLNSAGLLCQVCNQASEKTGLEFNFVITVLGVQGHGKLLSIVTSMVQTLCNLKAVLCV